LNEGAGRYPLWGKRATAGFGGADAAVRCMKIDGEKGQSGLRKFGWEAGRGGFAAAKLVRERDGDADRRLASWKGGDCKRNDAVEGQGIAGLMTCRTGKDAA
jgi:hypothetical protein